MQLLLSSSIRRVVLICFAILICSSVCFSKGSFTVKPEPAWVKKVVPAVNPVGGTSSTGASSTIVLDDEQVRVNGSSVEHYYHHIQRVESTAGLDDLSQLRFYFEPSYQQLTIHNIRILRGTSVINALKPSEIKIIQEEEDLDQQLYNGTLSALVFLNDIRVGDVVEYAYTIVGQNPILVGRFADSFYLASSEPIQELVVRLIFPTNRKLAIKADKTGLQPTKQTLGEDTEYLWYSKDVAAIPYDDSTPTSFNPFPRIIVSEFQTWSDVVNWALPYYQHSQLNNAELRSKVDEWKRIPEVEKRAIAALRFVQDEIRYLGIELGTYSHQPTSPEQVFARRFGDCKDKSLLLSSILNAMGIEAATVLVNTRTKSSLDDWQPTPFAFDHVIVRAKFKDKTYWFDPTISLQRGGLNNYYDPDYERGLVLVPGTSELETIPWPKSDASLAEVVESYTGPSIYGPVKLTVTRTFRGIAADEMRYSLSSMSLSGFSRMKLNMYADASPVITANELPVVEDDQTNNVLVVKEKYEIGELWKDNRHRFYAEGIWEEIQKPLISQRSTPLRVNYPLSLSHTILIDLGPGLDIPLMNEAFTSRALTFESDFSRNGNQLRMNFSLRTTSRMVPVEGVREHLEVLDQAQNFVGYDLSRVRTAVALASRRPPVAEFLIVGVVLLILVGLFIFWLIRRNKGSARKTEFVRELQARPGAAPETALPAATQEQFDSVLTNFNCKCGQPAYDFNSPPTMERFMYDGQRLVGVRLHCPACKQNNDLYLNPLFENQVQVADVSGGSEPGAAATGPMR